MTVARFVGIALLLASCVGPLVLTVIVTVKRDWSWPGAPVHAESGPDPALSEA